MEAKTLMIRLMMAYLFAILELALWADLSSATTYWVSPSGSATLCTDIDGVSDPGAYMTPAAIDTANCAAAGDTVVWKAGTYTGTRVQLTSVLPSGTSASVVSTHLCETDRGCIIAFSSITGGTGVMQTTNAQYYQIGRLGNGFIADCVNGGDQCAGVYLLLSGSIIATGVVVENVLVRNHHATAFNMSESQPTNYYDGVTWRYNENEESASPAYTGGGTPHGMYIKGHNVIVEYNRFRSITVSTANSYAMHGYHNVRHARVRFNDLITVGSLARGITLNDDETTPADTDNWAHNNIIRCPATNCGLAISFGPSNRANGTRAYNNTVYGFSQFLTVGVGNNNSHFVNNVCAGGTCAITNSGTNLTCGGTCSTTNPTVTAASHFVDAANGDFSLISTSSLINAGIDVSLPYSGAAPDRGAHESFTHVSASISTDVIAVTFNPTLSVIVAASTAGWSASCSGTNCPGGGNLTIDSVTRDGNTIANVQVSGFTGAACESGQTITVSFNASTGSLTDNALIGGTNNQEVFSFTSYAVTNNCTGSPPPTTGTFSQVAWKARAIFESTLSGGASPRDVVKGGAVGLSMQVDCTAAACTPSAFLPWYSKNGGSYQLLPSTPTADGISYYGIISGVYLGSTARLSGALTDAGSQVQRIGTDAAVVSLAQDSSYVVTVLIKLDPVLAGNGDTFSMKLRDQTGAEFTGTIVPSQITVIPMQAGVR